MAITTSAPSNFSNGYSVGPQKIQQLNFTAASGATSGTATFDRLSSIDYVIFTGLTQTAAPTFSGNVATFAFTDPAATVYGQVIAFGK